MKIQLTVSNLLGQHTIWQHYIITADITAVGCFKVCLKKKVASGIGSSLYGFSSNSVMNVSATRLSHTVRRLIVTVYDH
jgi:hypothetical protein